MTQSCSLHTEGMLRCDWLAGNQWLALSLLVNRHHTEFVFLSLVQVFRGGLGIVGADIAWNLLPSLRAFRPLLQNVLLDASAAVILRWFPGKSYGFWGRADSLQRTFRR